MTYTIDQKSRRWGALFGQAIGDSLGIRDEFLHPSVIAKAGRDRLQYVPSSRNGDSEFQAGEWSDDTEQALCLLQSYVDDREIVPTTVAKHLLDWLERDGRGCGSHTLMMLNDPVFSLNPIACSQDAWERSGQHSAANGAVMRVSVIGTLRPNDLDWTEKAAATSARITHYDPRCVASSVAVAIAIAMLIQGHTIQDAIKEAGIRASAIHPESIKYMNMSLEEMNLSEGLIPGKWNMKSKIGYTYKTLGAGFWALRNLTETKDFGKSLDPILAAGGDVDTNAAVAGALLGAALGLTQMPPYLIQGIREHDKLMTLAKQAWA